MAAKPNVVPVGVDGCSEKDALQRFSLSCENGMQKIEHAQTRPLNRKVIKIPTDEKTSCKEVIILETR